MRIVKWLLGIVLALVVLVLVIGQLSPKTFTVARAIDIAAPVDKVYALVEDPRQWARWTVWNQRDPAMQMSYSGAASGAGAAWSWTSASEGSGRMTFTAAQPDQRVAYDLSFPDFDTPARGDLVFAAVPGGTRVTWTMHGEMGANPLFRWFALVMDRMVGPDFDAGLANLKREAEKP